MLVLLPLSKRALVVDGSAAPDLHCLIPNMTFSPQLSTMANPISPCAALYCPKQGAEEVWV